MQIKFKSTAFLVSGNMHVTVRIIVLSLFVTQKFAFKSFIPAEHVTFRE